MRLFKICLLLLLLSLLACAPNGDSALTSPEIQRSQAEVRRAQTQVEQEVTSRMTSEQAKQLAARHLALKQTTWGKPQAVSEDEQHFYVSYETPQPEFRLIGSRMLIVNKETGLVSPQKRR